MSNIEIPKDVIKKHFQEVMNSHWYKLAMQECVDLSTRYQRCRIIILPDETRYETIWSSDAAKERYDSIGRIIIKSLMTIPGYEEIQTLSQEEVSSVHRELSERFNFLLGFELGQLLQK